MSNVTTKPSDLAVAIARCEGFFVPHSLPNRCNNPGDLEVGNVGFGICEGKTIFRSDVDGWAALERELDLIRSGQSRYYTPGMTISAFATIYSGGDLHYGQMLAEILNTTPDAQLSTVL